jgi:hypothetical protein
MWSGSCADPRAWRFRWRSGHDPRVRGVASVTRESVGLTVRPVVAASHELAEDLLAFRVVDVKHARRLTPGIFRRTHGISRGPGGIGAPTPAFIDQIA